MSSRGGGGGRRPNGVGGYFPDHGDLEEWALDPRLEEPWPFDFQADGDVEDWVPAEQSLMGLEFGLDGATVPDQHLSVQHPSSAGQDREYALAWQLPPQQPPFQQSLRQQLPRTVVGGGAIPSQMPRSSTMGSSLPQYHQQPVHRQGAQDHELTEEERGKLRNCRSMVAQRQREFNEAQRSVDEYPQLIRQRRRAAHDQSASMQRPATNMGRPMPRAPVNTSTRPGGFETSGTSQKRRANEQDGTEDLPDVDGQGRRVRPRLDLGHAETPLQSNASRPTNRAGGPRRHEHPADTTRASRLANRIGSSQPFTDANRSRDVNNMVGVPNINTITPNNFPRGGDHGNLHNSMPRTHTSLHAHLDAQSVSMDGVQAWINHSVTPALQQAFNTNPTAGRTTQTPARQLTGPQRPPLAPLGSFNRTNMLDCSASRSMPAAAKAGDAARASTKRPRARTEEDETNDDDDDESETSSETRPQCKRQRLDEHGKALAKPGTESPGQVDGNQPSERSVNIEGESYPAAYHHERRHNLLAEADLQGEYMYPMDRGVDPNDRTSFHPECARFNMAYRGSRPEILYRWDPPSKGQNIHPGYMRDPTDEKILLSTDNKPMLDWPEVPKTLSGQISGLHLEYFSRINQHIKITDLVARCPNKTQKPQQKERELKDNQTTFSAYTNRMQEARIQLGTRAWNSKGRSGRLQNVMESVMPQRVLDEREANNTTHTWRDLIKDEVEGVKHFGKEDETSDKVIKANIAIAGLRKEKAIDDALYASTGINRPPPLPTSQPLQQAPVFASQGGHQPAHQTPNPTPALPQGVPRAIRAPRRRQQPPSSQQVRKAPTTNPTAGMFGDDDDGLTLGEDQQLTKAAGASTAATPAMKVAEENRTNIQTKAPAARTTTTPAMNAAGENRPMTQTLDPAITKPVDIRFIKPYPQDHVARATITESLEITREAYRTVIGPEVPQTNTLESYATQWSELADWVKPFHHYEDYSWLIQRPAWYHSWDGWRQQNLIAPPAPPTRAPLPATAPAPPPPAGPPSDNPRSNIMNADDTAESMIKPKPTNTATAQGQNIAVAAPPIAKPAEPKKGSESQQPGPLQGKITKMSESAKTKSTLAQQPAPYRGVQWDSWMDFDGEAQSVDAPKYQEDATSPAKVPEAPKASTSTDTKTQKGDDTEMVASKKADGAASAAKVPEDPKTSPPTHTKSQEGNDTAEATPLNAQDPKASAPPTTTTAPAAEPPAVSKAVNFADYFDFEAAEERVDASWNHEPAISLDMMPPFGSATSAPNPDTEHPAPTQGTAHVPNISITTASPAADTNANVETVAPAAELTTEDYLNTTYPQLFTVKDDGAPVDYQAFDEAMRSFLLHESLEKGKSDG
ncbi:MAG: hypothetical protein Q9168_003606 [Polycauliona sp. 1 TL-2023]